MPETTLTGWKHRIADYAAVNGIPLGSSKVQRLAIRINKRFERYNDCDLGRILQHSDPTADQAVRNVMALTA